MMDHIRQRDWNSSKDHYKNFVDDRDINKCVVERIIRNQFWDPMISSEEDEPPGPIDWDGIFGKSNSRESAFRRFVPGFRKPPPHPKLSALTQDEHRQCIKVLSAQNPTIMPREFVGKTCKADWKVFEEKKEIYAKEQKEYIEWARQLWTTTHCIRALRPKPLVEIIYDAEFKLRSLAVQGFPKYYTLAAQIPLRDERHTCTIVLPKSDLIKVDISQLPQIQYPDIYESKQTIMQKCPIPEPCPQHPCRFQLPNESEVSLLPLPEIHKELAQFAFDNGAMFISSEGALACLLDPDRVWSLPLSVCAVLTAEGDTSNVVVLGSEFPERREPAPVRSMRAFRRMMMHVFTGSRPQPRKESECSDSSSSHRSLRSQASRPPGSNNKRSFNAGSPKVPPSPHKAAVTNNTAAKKVAPPAYLETSDDSDDDRLEIITDDDSSQNNNLPVKEDYNVNMTEETNKTNENSTNDQPRKILRARPRASTEKTNINQSVKELHISSTGAISRKSVTEDTIDNQDSSMRSPKYRTSSLTDPGSSKPDSLVGSGDEAAIKDLDVSLPVCVCKGTEFEKPLPRSYKNLLLKNHTTKEQLNVIVHSSHKLRNSMSCEVLLEPFPEYQLELGGAGLSESRARALAFSLMLRRGAELAIVRVDGSCGEVVTIDAADLRGLASHHGDARGAAGNTLCTALGQLAGLLPGAYVLSHEPSHGNNAVLFSRAVPGAPGCVPLQASDAPLTPAEEARLVQTAPALQPFLLPLHKYRRQLPLAFTYCSNQVAKETTTPANKKKGPPPAIQYPKRKGRKRGKKK